jgi:hypothetical protein
MIYECTDCKWCANFDSGFRVICLHELLPPNEVCKYYPVGDEDAERCSQFYDGSSQDFWMDDFGKAEKLSEGKYGEITYQGIRDWCNEQLKIRKGK